MAAIPPDQFQQLLDAARNGGAAAIANKRKLPVFSSGDPSGWLEWRVAYVNIRELNGWNDDAVCVAQIKAAMQGYAAMAVQGINEATPGALLNAYEAKFCTAASSVQARQMFLAAKQDVGEAITAWHTRVITLYRRADPAANLNTTRELIDRFIFGLAHPTVLERTLDARPADMAAALAEATSRAATVNCLAELEGRKPGPGLNALTDKEREERKQVSRCFNCDTLGHYARDCMKPHRALAGRGRGRGRGMGRRRGGGGGSTSGTRPGAQPPAAAGGRGSGLPGRLASGGGRVTIGALTELLGNLEVVDDAPTGEPRDAQSGN